VSKLFFFLEEGHNRHCSLDYT